MMSINPTPLCNSIKYNIYIHRLNASTPKVNHQCVFSCEPQHLVKTKTLVKKTSVPKRKTFKKTKTFFSKSLQFVQTQILALLNKP